MLRCLLFCLLTAVSVTRPALAQTPMAPGTSGAVSSSSSGSTSSTTAYPVVFVHGFAGWGQFPGYGTNFDGMHPALAGKGEQAFFPDLPPFAPPTVRAPILAAEIQRILDDTGADKVHIIAHSLGGIDARKAIADFDLDDKVFSLTTVSTPHHGTPVAGLFQHVPGPLLWPIFAPMDFAYDVLRQREVGPMDISGTLEHMSEEALVEFNAAYPPPDAVHLFSIAGVTSHPTDACDGPWGKPSFEDAPIPFVWPTFFTMRMRPRDSVANDGVVDVMSARWEGFLGCIPADHFDEVGKGADLFASPQSGVLDHRAFYLDYVARLRQLERTNDRRVVEVPLVVQAK